MKLHLPKQLFTALLAALTLATPAAKAATMAFEIERDTNNNITYDFEEATGIEMTYTNWTYSGSGANNVGSFQSPSNLAYQDSFSPDGQLRSGQEDSWTMNFTLDFSGLNTSYSDNDDSDVVGVVITGFSFDAYAINGGGSDKTASIPATGAITVGDSTAVSSSVTLAYGGETAKIELNLADPISYSAENSSLECHFTLSNARNYNTYAGLIGGEVLYAASIQSGANVTWVDDTNATWSGESWKTAAGTRGIVMDARVGNATFADAAGGSHTVTVDAAAEAASITVSSGNYTFAAGSYTVDEVATPGTLSITNGMTINEGASATFNVDTTLEGTVTNNGTLNMGSFTVEEGDTAIFSGTGTTVLAGTVTNNGTLNMSGFTVAADTEATFSGTGTTTIQLNENATLNKITNTGSGTITLTGSGTYDLGSGITTLGSGISLGLDNSPWTGTVTLSGISTAAGLNMNSFGNENSKVKLDGVSGWFARAKLNPHIVLGNNGLTFTDYSTNEVYNFANGISGNGNFVVSANASSVTATPFIAIGSYSSNSDTSPKWSGKFMVDNVYGSVTLLLNGGGTYFDAGSTNAGIEMNDADNTLSLYVGYATATNESSNNISDYVTTGDTQTTINGAISNKSAGNLELTVLNDTVFNKEVAVTSMTVNSGKTATMNATLEAGTVTNSGELKLADKATISGGTMSNVQMSSSGISGTADGASVSNADVQIAQLAQDASFTIEDMTLTNTTITAATTTEVNLKNVDAENLALAKGKFTMEATPAVGVAFDTGVSSLAAGSASLTLNLDMMGAYASTGAVNGVTLTITLDVDVSGVDLNSYTVEKWQALVGFDQESWLGQALVNATFTTEAVPSAETGEAAPTVSYGYAAGDGGSNVGTLTITITGLNVPEPTTATLSLMALAALAARRRRK